MMTRSATPSAGGRLRAAIGLFDLNTKRAFAEPLVGMRPATVRIEPISRDDRPTHPPRYLRRRAPTAHQRPKHQGMRSRVGGQHEPDQARRLFWGFVTNPRRRALRTASSLRRRRQPERRRRLDLRWCRRSAGHTFALRRYRRTPAKAQVRWGLTAANRRDPLADRQLPDNTRARWPARARLKTALITRNSW